MTRQEPSGCRNVADQGNEHIHITRKLAVPLSELVFRFSRSGGPGGQNVNRRETQVELCFDVQASPSLNEAQRALLLKRLAGQIDREGTLHIVANTHRSQVRNRQEAIKRFVALIRQGLHVPRRRRPTRASRRSVEQRLARKRKRADVKRLRRPVQANDV